MIPGKINLWKSLVAEASAGLQETDCKGAEVVIGYTPMLSQVIYLNIQNV